jgi:acetate kinase
MTAALDHLDAVVFTGGIGENSAEIRARAVDRFAWLGAAISPVKNERLQLDADIATDDATTRVLVIKSREDLAIAEACRKVLGIAVAR